MAARVGQFSSAAFGARTTAKDRPRVHDWLVVGSHLLLRYLLVALLSDDSLRAHPGLAGLFTLVFAGRLRGPIPGALLRFASACGLTFWSGHDFRRTADLGL